MPSNESANTFDNAAALIRIAHGRLKGFDIVVDALRKKYLLGPTNPVLHPEIAFEPWIASQQLRVPHATAEILAAEFCRLKLLAIWTRAECELASESDDGMIIDTNSADELEAALDSSCPNCGGIHSAIGQVRYATKYAPNHPENGRLKRFNHARLRMDPRKVEQAFETETGSLEARHNAIIHHSTAKPISNAVVVAQLLRSNSPAEAVPSPATARLGEWAVPIAIVLIYLPFTYPLARLGIEYLVAVSAAATVMFVATIWSQVSSKLAGNALQRGVASTGGSCGLLLVAAGVSGLRLDMNSNVSSPIIVSGQEVAAIPIEGRYGEVDYPLLLIGLTSIVMTMLFVLAYDGKLGWFSLATRKLS